VTAVAEAYHGVYQLLNGIIDISNCGQLLRSALATMVILGHAFSWGVEALNLGGAKKRDCSPDRFQGGRTSRFSRDFSTCNFASGEGFG
jgi:hypothetical protein